MKITYQELKDKHRTVMNEFKGIFFAFSNKQFAEGLEKLEIKEGEAKAKIASIGGCGFILKDRSAAFKAMIESFDTDMERLKTDKALLLDALIYELGNHEYCITYDVTDALDSLSLKSEDIPADILKEAKRQSLELSFA